MDLFKQGMKGPTRPAPVVPGFAVNRYSPVTNWNDDPFGADVFEPTPLYTQRKKPPPRPPPPKVKTMQPDIPAKPSHFIRKPTVLTTLLSRKSKTAVTNPSVNSNQQNLLTDLNSDIDTIKIFPKCEPKNVQTGALIDLSSPPSSPTFTTRSSSDGLSVDSFGSDATTSTNHHNAFNGGNASQAESGFEDDFELYLHSRKKYDTTEDLAPVDPFSPQPVLIKPPISRKPVLNKDLFELSSGQPTVPSLKGPTIIRAKPARPKPPDSTAILKSTFGNNLPIITPMTVNTTAPIHKVGNGFNEISNGFSELSNSLSENFDTKSLSWDDDSSLEVNREPSPPMPSIPPPPPPEVIDDDLPIPWPDAVEDDSGDEIEEPYAIALFDYFTDHQEDLCFSANSKIRLLRRVNDEWLFGRLHCGTEGLFPVSYVDIKVPLPNETLPPLSRVGVATAMYDFVPSQPDDLGFRIGDTINVMHKLNEEWYYGECNGNKGQFPFNYVQMS